jgi:hypothetical protein
MKLTKREVTLLFLLAVVAMAYFAISFLILPQFKNNLDKANTIISLNDQLAALKIEDQTDGNVDILIEKENERYAELSKPFLESFDREQIDYWLNSLINENNLKKYSISYSDITSSGTNFDAERVLPDSKKIQLPLQNAVDTITGVPTAAPQPSSDQKPAAFSLPAQQTGEAAAGENNAAAASQAGQQTAAVQMYSMQAELNITGSYNDISKFMDALYSSGRMLAVNGFNINDFEGGGRTAVVSIRFFSVPLLDGQNIQAYDFPVPSGRDTLMAENAPTEPSPSPSASPAS